ncbi:MAG: amidohydrolase [Deltaproteobacteria bacterium]|nr:amidohydrolase [Deltaproteobacteria bacterium]
MDIIKSIMPINTEKPVNNSKYETPDIIIKGGTLLTMVDGEAPIENASVHIKGDRVLDIRPAGISPSDEGTEIINADKCIVMPGLVNGHCHTAMTIFRGYADDLSLNEWLYKRIFPAEAAHATPENVYWGALLGCLEMIASGTTSLIDGYFYEDESFRAVHESGMRAILGQGVIDFPAPGVTDPKENLRIGKEFIEKHLHFSGLITPGLFCHSPVTCSDKTLARAMEISMEYSVPMQTHLSETRKEVDKIINRTGKRPALHLNDLGLLNKNLIAAHSVHLDDEEITLLSRKGVKVVHSPESNMKLSSGVARVTDMIDAGIKPGIGTDGCASNNNLDLFKEMDTAAKLGKVFTSDPSNLKAGTVLRMATIWGAGVMGLGDQTGTIERGKKADIIVVDTRSPNMTPLYNPVSSLVYSASGSDVKDVVVNGRILMKDRMFLTLDCKEITARVRAIGREIK